MNTHIYPCVNPVPWAMCFISPAPIDAKHVTFKHSFFGDETQTTRRCAACGEMKELHHFYSRNRNGKISYNANCIQCDQESRRGANFAEIMEQRKQAYLVKLQEREAAILAQLASGPKRVSALMKILGLKRTTLCNSLCDLRDRGLVTQIGHDVKTMWTLK